MRQLAVPFALLASLVLGCDSAQRAERPDASAAPDAAAQPRLFWMCTLFEVPPDAEIAPDGTLRRAAGRGNGFAEVPAADISEVFASIEAYPGTRFVAAPAIITRPGERGRLEMDDRDKAGASIGARSIAVEGTPATVGLAYELEMTTGPGSSCGTGARRMDEGRATLLLCRGDDASAPWTLLIVRPSILRDPATGPYQSAASVEER